MERRRGGEFASVSSPETVAMQLTVSTTNEKSVAISQSSPATSEIGSHIFSKRVVTVNFQIYDHRF